MAGEKTYDFSTICRHCDKETIEPIQATVTGTIPEWAEGVYVYNGPALTKIGDIEYRHCLDSAAMIQKVTVSSNGCWYQSRYLQSHTLSRNLSAGTITVSEFGTGAQNSSTIGFFSKMRKMTDTDNLISDNAVVNVAKVAGKYYALGETPFMLELDLDTLLTKGKIFLYKELGLVNMTPHPAMGEDGNTYGIGQSLGLSGPKYNVVKFPADGGAPRVVARVPSRWRMSPCYMHSFGITENYLILMEQPLAMSLMEALADILNSAPFIDCIKWHQDTVLLHVLDMRTWKLLKQRFVLKTLFMFHFANCYEDADGNIVMDFPSYPDAKMLKDMYISNLRSVKGSAAREMVKHYNNTITRAVLPLYTANSGADVSVSVRTISNSPFENPLVNPKYQRRRHRFIYGTGQSPEARNYGQVTKLDVETGEIKTFSEEGLYTSELVFIPRPGSKTEDDGVVVTVCVVSDQLQLGCIVMLDAASLSEIARVTYTPDATVPLPLHGTFQPSAKASQLQY